MEFTTGERAICDLPEVLLTVRRCAWEHLSSTLDPQQEVLALLWGSYGESGATGWIVSTFRREDLPAPAGTNTYETTLDRFTVLIPQRQHLAKLHGRTLTMRLGELTVM